MGGSADTSSIRVEPLNYPNLLHLERVKQLGIENTGTLGLFPPAAFDDYARRGQILIAAASDASCVGYVLFSTANDRARIFHLCVDQAYRGRGVARLLVDALAARTGQLRGITLRCRRDYAANTMWPKLGFQAMELGPGRSKAGLPLVTWWRSNGGPDLFTEARRQIAEAKLPVVIDANVLFDLRGRPTGTDGTSEALQADWLTDLIELYVTPEVHNEIIREGNTDAAQKSLSFAKQFPCVESDRASFERVGAALRPHFGEIANPRDESDFRQVTWAIAAGARYFVTRDTRLHARGENIGDVFRIQILSPSELIVQLDELRRADAYQPASLAATALTVARIGAGQADDLARAFQNQQTGEKKASLLTKLQACLASPNRFDAFVVAQDGKPLALYAIDNQTGHDDVAGIPILRAAATPAGTALARHIARRIILTALERGKRIVRVTDEYGSDSVLPELQQLGFFESADGWTKISLPQVSLGADAAQMLRSMARALPQDAKSIEEWATLLSRRSTIEDEQALWPLKLVDADLPAYVVPIEPRWARELFDEGLAAGQLFGRDTTLGIAIEAAYYRSCRGCTIQPPARLLWYVSDGFNEPGTKALRASSRLDEVVVGKPKALFRKFRRLGVYQWSDVYAAAHENIEADMMAMRFSGTELFKRPVLYSELKDELTAARCNPTMVGPVPIPAALFLKLYAKAVR